jgi:hypothetical protein
MGEHKLPRQKLGPIWKTSWYHRAAIEQSERCGCFYCEKIFPPAAITRWIDAREQDEPDQTAVCPFCGIDAVIGSGSGHEVTPKLLAKLRATYFG